jgi:hypothetical protein
VTHTTISAALVVRAGDQHGAEVQQALYEPLSGERPHHSVEQVRVVVELRQEQLHSRQQMRWGGDDRGRVSHVHRLR